MTSDPESPPPRVHADEVARNSARLYDGIVDWYVDAFFDDLTDADWLDRWVRHLPSHAVVADVGAGPGNFARYLVRSGLQTFSTDISLQMTRASRRLVSEAAAFVSDMRAIPLRTASLDGLLCAYSLMHVPSPANRLVLAEFGRVLVPGGFLQVMVKTGTKGYSFESSAVAGVASVMEPWERDQLLQALSAVGFEMIEVDERPSTSPQEFDHPKLMVICRRSFVS